MRGLKARRRKLDEILELIPNIHSSIELEYVISELTYKYKSKEYKVPGKCYICGKHRMLKKTQIWEHHSEEICYKCYESDVMLKIKGGYYEKG